MPHWICRVANVFRGILACSKLLQWQEGPVEQDKCVQQSEGQTLEDSWEVSPQCVRVVDVGAIDGSLSLNGAWHCRADPSRDRQLHSVGEGRRFIPAWCQNLLYILPTRLLPQASQKHLEPAGDDFPKGGGFSEAREARRALGNSTATVPHTLGILVGSSIWPR